MTLDIIRIESPVGELTCIVRDETLVGVAFGPRLRSGRPERQSKADGDRGGTFDYLRKRFPGSVTRDVREGGGVRAAFARYFGGETSALDALRVDPGGTPFQSKVWLALREIAAGKTWSYQQLAERVGSPAAMRAVGAANGANPIPLVLPCHRVIGKNGKLVGYGGGMDRKVWLLKHEGCLEDEQAGLAL